MIINYFKSVLLAGVAFMLFLVVLRVPISIIVFLGMLYLFTAVVIIIAIIIAIFKDKNK